MIQHPKFGQLKATRMESEMDARKRLTYYPTRIEEVIPVQARYLDDIQEREGLAAARAVALDQLAANVLWLTLKERMERRKLYLILQRITDSVVQPDLVESKT